MGEVDKIISKYEKYFSYDVSELESEIQKLLPTIIDSFVSFYGEDRRMELEDKFRKMYFLMPPADIRSVYNRYMCSDIREYLQKKYPNEKIEFNEIFDILNYSNSNNVEFKEELQEIIKKLEKFKTITDDYELLRKKNDEKITEEVYREVVERINAMLKQDVGYSDEMLSKFQYDFKKGAVTAVVDVVDDVDLKKFLRVVNKIKELRKIGINIPELNFEKKWSDAILVPKSEKEAALEECRRVLTSDEVIKYLPKKVTAEKIRMIWQSARDKKYTSVDFETMKQLYNISELPNNFLGDRKYKASFGDCGGSCEPKFYQQGDNLELGNVITLVPFFWGENVLGGSLIHECNHAIEATCYSTDRGTYMLGSGWDTVMECDSKTYECYGVSTNSYRNIELFNEVINDFIAREVWHMVKEKSSSYIMEKIQKNTYYNAFFMAEEFYKMYKPEIIQSRKNGNMDILFEKVGKENMEEMIRAFDNLSQKVMSLDFDYDKTIEKINKGIEDEDTKFLMECISDRDRILSNMQVYSQGVSRSRGITTIHNIITVLIISILCMIFILKFIK